jgi:CheY-like chemotaxis protein
MDNPSVRPILLVEDNPMDLDLTLRAFKNSHLANPIVVARDGQEALDWIERWEAGETLPIVVLLDLKLPKVDGLEVLRRLRDSAVACELPVVVLTSSNDQGDVANAYALHANSYIVKPVSFENFTEVAKQIKLYWCVINRPPG